MTPTWVALAHKYGWIALALVMLALGWLLRGWAAQPVDANTLALMDTLRVTRAAYEASTHARTHALTKLQASTILLEQKEAVNDSLVARLYAEGRRHRQQAGALEAELGAAQSAADSVPILVTQKAQLMVALDTIERVVTTMEVSRSLVEQRNEQLAAQLGLYREQRATDSTRLHLQEIVLAGLKKAKAPCGRWCPTLIGVYDVKASSVNLGAGVRPRSWLTIGATYQVTP